MYAKSVIAVIDIGKTNKKLFLFDSNYNLILEKSAKFNETVDEDGFPCENIEALRSFVFDSLRDVFLLKAFNIKAISIATYGASIVYIDNKGTPLTPLYSYLKPYPKELEKIFYDNYGGKELFSTQTASPFLGSLNSGLQIYRIKHESPGLFAKIQYALHLPQYISYLVNGQICSDITSIGCHTNLWNFNKNKYHNWVKKEKILVKLAPIVKCDTVTRVKLAGRKYCVGVGLHDSSAALIPYLVHFKKPFVLISTGTWCISMNPFNKRKLTYKELKKNCLTYLNYYGKPVKSSRIFAGQQYEEQVLRISAFFNRDPDSYNNINYDNKIITTLLKTNLKKENINQKDLLFVCPFEKRDLSDFSNDLEAYHQLMLDIIYQQYVSSKLVLKGTDVRRIYVDGGFSKNVVYMNLLALAFPKMKVYAAYMAQATALGAAMVIHYTWNKKAYPKNIIQVKSFSASGQPLLRLH